MKVTPEEDAQLRARAVVREVTVSRLLFESATADVVVADAEWKAVAADLMRLRTQMGYVSNNLNQLAKFANIEGRFPEEAVAAAAEYRTVVSEYRAAMRKLVGG